MSLAFVLTSLAIVATPGMGVVLTISAGLAGGRRRALITAAGCTVGIVPHLLAALTGTAALLAAGGMVFEVLKIAGICYLVWMAWSTWRASGSLQVKDDSPEEPAGRLIWTAVLANLLNPKLTLFFFAFLPQFLDPARPQLPQMLLLSGVFTVLTLVVFMVYGLLAAAARRHVIDRPRVVKAVQRAFAVGYLALAAKLATVER